MQTKDDKILEQLLEYIKDDRNKQAILIDGEWGAGKTFFVKEKLIKTLETELLDKKVYYISLYGINEVRQIMDEICSAMFQSFIEEKAGKEAGEKVGKAINVTSKLLMAGMKYFNIEKDDLPRVYDIKDIKNAVFIFDDLERCEIEVNQTLGMINNLVEHNDARVVLVANQDEIGKMTFAKELPQKYMVAMDNRVVLDDRKNSEEKYTKEILQKRAEMLFEENIFYKKVKEKLIGLTIYYRSNLEEVFPAVVETYIKSSSVKENLTQNRQEIISIFEERKHYNIRTLVFGMVAYEKIFEILEALTFTPVEYIEEEKLRILRYVMELAIQIKSGKEPYSWRNSSAQYGIVRWKQEGIFEKGRYGYKFVDEYLIHCSINPEEVKRVILEIANEKKERIKSKEMEQALQYNNLYMWWEFEDEEIEEILEKLLEELKEQKYTPRYFKEIIVSLMQMEYNGFDKLDYERYISFMKEILDDYSEPLEKRYIEILSDNSDFVNKYNEIMKPLFEIIDNKEIINKRVNNGFLYDKKQWNDDFERKCEECKTAYINDNKFLYYIDPEEFIEQLKGAKVKEIRRFVLGLRKVYNFSNLNEFFKSDVPNLEKIVSCLDIEELSNGKKTRKMALTDLKNKLQESLELIKRPTYRV